MIVDSLKNCSRYCSVHTDFDKVFEYLKGLSGNIGKREFVLDEGRVYGSVSVVTELNNIPKCFEAHRKFIDLHYIVSGKERFGYANIEGLKTEKEYDFEKDYELLSGEVSSINLSQGDFCIVFPEDAHIPKLEKLTQDNLIRVVVKIKVS